jgi:uncharacterized protein involved in exopolysaccharide biosynthesis
VRSRGRGLPASLSVRMTEEWAGELDAMSSRAAKLAFAIGIRLTRRRSFASVTEDAMTPEITRRSMFSSFFGSFGGWKTLIAAPTVVLALVAYGASFLIQPQYRAEAVIFVVPAKVPDAYVKALVNIRVEDRMKTISETILSRTRLEHIMEEFNLYATSRRAGAPGEDTVNDMRSHIDLALQHGDTVRISYTGTQPTTVTKVTDRLTAYFIEESLRQRTSEAANTTNFLETQLEDTRRRLIDQVKRVRVAGQHGAANEDGAVLTIEYEALEANYKDLLAKREQAAMGANLQRLQIGEQLSLLEPARVPEHPVTPDRTLMTLIGAVTGLALGIALLIGGWSRRSRRPQEAVAQ